VWGLLLLANEFPRSMQSFSLLWPSFSPLTFLFFPHFKPSLISQVMASPVLLNYLQDGVGGWSYGGVISGPRSSFFFKLHLTPI
jgi:hypothetical protein